jgi:hypothetical protein
VYILAVEGQERQQILDLPGLYKVVAMHNPMDGRPLSLDSKAIASQMTVRKQDCVLPQSTRDALHALIWNAVEGEVATYRFMDGPAIAVTVMPGSEYKPPPKQRGKVQAPPAKDGRYRVRRFGGR